MAKCSACGKFLKASSTAVQCGSCTLVYHKACLSLPDTASVSKDWVCPCCKQKCRKGDNSSTPIKSLTDSTDAPAPSPPQPVSAISSSAQGIMPDAFRDEMRNWMAEMRELIRAELAQVRSVMSGFSERLEGLEKRIQAIEKGGSFTEEAANTVQLEQTVATLRLELNDRDQEALLSDVDIGLLPEEAGESAVHAVKVLASQLGVRLEDSDVVFAERVGPAPGAAGGRPPRRLVVRLARRQLRDDLLQAARVRRTVAAPGQPATRVYVNERLTRNNRALYRRARSECRAQHWRFVWTRRGRIYVRQAEGAPLHQVRKPEDLDKLFGAAASQHGMDAPQQAKNF